MQVTAAVRVWPSDGRQCRDLKWSVTLLLIVFGVVGAFWEVFQVYRVIT